MSIRVRTIALVSVAVVVLLALSVINEYAGFRKRLVESNGRLMEGSRGTFEANLKTSLGNLSLAVKTIAENHETASLLAAGDREGLLRLYKDYFESAKTEFAIDQFQFHVPPATSFLRLHQVDKFGDDLSKFRATVVQANRDKKPVVGLEVGRGGPGTRVVYPVSLEGRHIGTVEMGGSIAGVLRNIQDIFKVDFAIGIYRHVFEQASRFEAGKKDIVLGETIFYDYSADSAQDLARRFKPGQTDYTIQGRHYFAATFPISDYSGETVGQILVIKDQTAVIAELLRSLLVSVGLMVLVAAAALWALSISIGRILSPMRDVANAMDGIAAWDLSADISSNGSHDEIGRALTSAAMMVRRLREAVTSIQLATVRITTSSEEIEVSANQLANGAQHQASTLEETSAAVEQLAASVEQVAKSAGNQAAAIQESVQSEIDLKRTVEKVAAALREVSLSAGQSNSDARAGADSVKKAVEAIQSISASADQISGIVGVISDIADQTNLLALNAAIEAARAGEHGRGFAVVADEVSKLAERSSISTKEIAGLIQKSGKSVALGVDTSQEALRSMDGIISGAKKTGEMLSALAQDTERQIAAIDNVSRTSAAISETSQSISAATEEQSVNAREVARAVESVNELTQQAASAAEQMSSATGDLSSLAQDLQRLLDQFKLGQERSHMDIQIADANVR